MDKKKYLRFALPAVLACAFIMIGLYKVNSLKGQIAPGAPVLLSPTGEALQIDSSQQAANTIPTIRVSWTVGSVSGRDYEITLRAVEKGRQVWTSPLPQDQKIIIPYASLTDKINPSYDLPIINRTSTNPRNYWKLEPFVEYEIAVTYAGTIPSTTTSRKTFWYGIKNTSYNNMMFFTRTPSDKVTPDKALATWDKLPDQTRKYIIELSNVNGLDTYVVDTRSLANVYAPSFDFTTKKPLERNVEYKFRVMGEDVYGTKSLWSAYRTFTVYDDPFSNLVPEIISPTTIVKYEYETKLSWKAVPGAKYYRLEIFGVNIPNFTHSIIVKNEQLTDINNPSTVVSLPFYSSSVNSVTPNPNVTTYKWHIVAYSEKDTASKPSNEVPFGYFLPDFKTVKPEIVAPIGDVPLPVDRLQFSWKSIHNVSDHEITIYEERQKTGTTQKELIKLGAWTDELKNRFIKWNNGIYTLNLKDFKWNKSGTGDAEFPLLKENTQYYYTIQGVSYAGRTLVSDRIPLKIRPMTDDEFKTMPLEVSTSNHAIPGKMLHWTVAPGATSYIISVKDYTEGKDIPATNYTIKEGDANLVNNLHYTTYWKDQTSKTTESYIVGKGYKMGNSLNLKEGGLYGVWVRGVRDVSDTNKIYTPWSKRFVFVYANDFYRSQDFNLLLKPKIVPFQAPVSASPEIQITTENQNHALSLDVGAMQIFIRNNTKNVTEKVFLVKKKDLKSNHYTRSYKSDYTFAPGAYTAWVRFITGGEMTEWSKPEVFTIAK